MGCFIVNNNNRRKEKPRHRMHYSVCAVYMPIFYTYGLCTLAAVSYHGKLTAENQAALSIKRFR